MLRWFSTGFCRMFLSLFLCSGKEEEAEHSKVKSLDLIWFMLSLAQSESYGEEDEGNKKGRKTSPRAAICVSYRMWILIPFLCLSPSKFYNNMYAYPWIYILYYSTDSIYTYTKKLKTEK